ncbi:putative pentatricopeptide repeat-containing protein At5g47460 [Andrographis paniculata]|uniref:putative pentatricopeptide repeat-containing protein At5g47460 n=1 Tax=Andrographis paniculata TaxID=175694 RepID=UPI0021E832C6|nr:putative pentatricopeptide repeat-containing protein At5g47460 [Andrographis paniculata]
MLGKLISTQRLTQNYTFRHYQPRATEFNQRISWTTVISELASDGENSERALGEAAHLFRSGLKPDDYGFVHLTRACANGGRFSNGVQLHSLILKSGIDSNLFVSTALVDFYVKHQQLDDAHQMFDEMRDQSVVTWNTLISGYVRSGQFRRALNLFVHLEKSNISADSYSFTAALSACGQLRLVQFGRSLHSKVVKHGVDCSVYISNCLIDMYGKCGYGSMAMEVFEEMAEKDIISWNSILAAHCRNGDLEQAFAIFRRIPDPDTISYNEVIDGVARFGVLEDAVGFLLRMPSPNSSSWNAIITGYVNRGRGRDAVEIFTRMRASRVHTDEFTFSSILSGIAGLSNITLGISMHCCVIKCGLDSHVVVGSALVDMYFKCGKVEEAKRLFQWLPEKNLVTWNAVICGYAHNGNSKRALELFEQMKTTLGLQPDEITFLNVISACWHSRLPLKTAHVYLRMMIDDYWMDPMPEHCSLMIKIMGQEGDVTKAVKMITDLGFDSCGIVWKALLGACGTSGSVEVAELAAGKVMELEGDDEYVYVMLSNIYASHGRWEEASCARRMMNERKVRKEVAYSLQSIKDAKEHNASLFRANSKSCLRHCNEGMANSKLNILQFGEGKNQL